MSSERNREFSKNARGIAAPAQKLLQRKEKNLPKGQALIQRSRKNYEDECLSG
jgi:hypothetical protein